VPRIALSLVVTHSIPELPAYQPNAWPPLADTDEHAATLQSTVADLGVMQSALASTGNSFDVLSVASAICCRCRCCCFCCRSVALDACSTPSAELVGLARSLTRSPSHNARDSLSCALASQVVGACIALAACSSTSAQLVDIACSRLHNARDALSCSQVVGACIAVAGPVKDDRVTFTNLGWVICGRTIESEFGIPKVKLINDFVAVGYGLLTLTESQYVVVSFV
jgi:hypothetical protein